MSFVIAFKDTYMYIHVLNSRFYLPLDWYFSDVLDD